MSKLRSKGTIALDIDGTIADATHMISEKMRDYLAELEKRGWKLVFLTGRSFSFAMMSLRQLSFPYFLAVQNGADLFHMPDNKLLSEHYLGIESLSIIEKAYEGGEEDFLIYAGHKLGDFCYFRPDQFSEEMHAYFDLLMKLSPQPWYPVTTYQDLPIASFPLIKAFGPVSKLKKIERNLRELSDMETSIIRDPIDESKSILLITDKDANKGKAACYLMEKCDLSRPLITGGDDLNDLTFLPLGDIIIAMENAPDLVKEKADIIAPAVEKNGMVEGLKQAIEFLQKN